MLESNKKRILQSDDCCWKKCESSLYTSAFVKTFLMINQLWKATYSLGLLWIVCLLYDWKVSIIRCRSVVRCTDDHFTLVVQADWTPIETGSASRHLVSVHVWGSIQQWANKQTSYLCILTRRCSFKMCMTNFVTNLYDHFRDIFKEIVDIAKDTLILIVSPLTT